mmetsp:Transcript_17939/g.44793  ORF Transcript_17939/g.44793 Transcript_17939/m.44793 type:complete len:533 (+) Transcript_17939:1140-2738(+)
MQEATRSENCARVSADRVLNVLDSAPPGFDLDDDTVKETLKAVDRDGQLFAGGNSKYQTERLHELKNLTSKWKQRHSDPEGGFPEQCRKVIDWVGRPNFTSFSAHEVGFRAVMADYVIKEKEDPVTREYSEQVSGHMAERLEFDEKIRQRGAAILVKNGQAIAATGRKGAYWYGLELVKHPDPEYHGVFFFPTKPEDVVFRCGILRQTSAPQKEFKATTRKGVFEIDLGADFEDDLIHGEKVHADYFQYAPESMQMHLLGPWLEKTSGLDESHLQRATKATRMKIWQNYRDGNELNESEIETLKAVLGPQAQEFLFNPSTSAARDARVEREVEAAAARAGKVANRKEMELNGDRNAASGITRQRAVLVFDLYEATKKSKRHLAQARPHRRQQGLLPDRIRLTYMENVVKTSGVVLHPSVTAEGEPLSNVERVLVPACALAAAVDVEKIIVEERSVVSDEVSCWVGEDQQERVSLVHAQAAQKNVGSVVLEVSSDEDDEKKKTKMKMKAAPAMKMRMKKMQPRTPSRKEVGKR